MMASRSPLTSCVRKPAQQDGRADGRVPGERQLADGREDADARRVGRVLRLQHEHGLGEIELAGDGQHLLIAQPIGLADDSQGIAAKGAIGEYVERVQRQRHASHYPH